MLYLPEKSGKHEAGEELVPQMVSSGLCSLRRNSAEAASRLCALLVPAAASHLSSVVFTFNAIKISPRLWPGKTQ